MKRRKRSKLSLRHSTISEGTKFSANKPLLALHVHRVRYVDFIPRTILCLASTPYIPNSRSKSYLAVSREGGSVELLSVNEKWRCVKSFTGIRTRDIDSMFWTCGYDGSNMGVLTASDVERELTAHEIHAKQRLFGASRDGTIFEIDFAQNRHTGVIGSGGGAVFCLTGLCPCSPSFASTSREKEEIRAVITNKCCGYIAAGCEDGCIRIFYQSYRKNKLDNYDGPCLELVSILPSMCLSVISITWKWNTETCVEELIGGSFLYAGTVDGTISKFECISNKKSSSELVSSLNFFHKGTDLCDNRSNDFQYRWKPSTRITINNSTHISPVRIWCLKALHDGTVVSGDSCGNIQFWNMTSGVLLQTFEHNPNNADVLDIAVTDDQCKIMASGVDCRVVCIERISSAWHTTQKNDRNWILTSQQRSHTHDVTSLAIVHLTKSSDHVISEEKEILDKPFHQQLLCSGGVDTKVCSYLANNMQIHRPKVVYKLPSIAPISLAREKRMFSVMRSDKIDFYQLNNLITSFPPTKNGNVVSMDESKMYVGSIRLSESIYNLSCSHINDDGSLLAVSDSMNLMLFSLNYVDQTLSNGSIKAVLRPSKISVPIDINTPCSLLKFFPQLKGQLACATLSGTINILWIYTSDCNGNKELEFNNENPYTTRLLYTFGQNYFYDTLVNEYPVSELSISPDGSWLAVGISQLEKGSINIFSVGSTYQHWWTLPPTETPHSCLSFSEGIKTKSALVVGCSNCAFYIFDVERRCLSDWSLDLGIPVSTKFPKELINQNDCPTRLAFNPATPNMFLMAGQSWFCGIDLDLPIPKKAQFHPPNHIKVKLLGENSFNDKRIVSKARNNFDLNESHLSKKSKSSKLNSSPVERNNFTLCLQYSGIIFMEFLDENELIIIQQPWLDIVNTLPDTLEWKRYGS